MTPHAQAAAATPVEGIKVLRSVDMTPEQLQQATARPRVDFTSILGLVRTVWTVLQHRCWARVGHHALAHM